jgi:hypothetical protein
MSTLKSLAQKFNLYTSSDLPDVYKKYYNEMCENTQVTKVKVPDLEYPDFDLDLFFECRVQDAGTNKELYYIERYYIIVKHKSSDVLFMLMTNNQGKFYLHPYYGQSYKYNGIDPYKKNELLSTIKEPHYIGVFSERKLVDWVKYGIQYMATLESLYIQVNEANEAHKKNIDLFISSLNGDCKINHYDNSWHITTKLFDVTFNLDKRNGYLSHNIIFKGGLTSVAEIVNKL